MTSRWLLKGITKARGAVHNERGATAVEFALVAPIFLIFVIGIIDLGRLFFIKNVMQSTVEESARYAMVNPSATHRCGRRHQLPNHYRNLHLPIHDTDYHRWRCRSNGEVPRSGEHT